ncbi:MAG TPA: M23 family metallopeptidase [Micromonosporaceae bacterium]|nr:M23 family metallopeptidase [Micromonosporaceae bacterium]
MQENQSSDNRTSADVLRGRHRAPEKSNHRRAYVASVAVALAGFGLAALAATSGDTGHGRPEPAAVALEEQSRADAAERADRSERNEATPAAPEQTLPAPSPTQASAEPSPPAPSKAATPAPTRKPAWVNPMPGARTTSCYGPRWGTLHAGIDLAAPENTPIVAAGAGTVTITGWAYTGYGISVVINHGNGILTHYAHMNKSNVRVGQRVSAGDLIGWEGSTGDSTGPHLHFEVHKGMWNQVNPGPWMRTRGINLGC